MLPSSPWLSRRTPSQATTRNSKDGEVSISIPVVYLEPVETQVECRLQRQAATRHERVSSATPITSNKSQGTLTAALNRFADTSPHTACARPSAKKTSATAALPLIGIVHAPKPATTPSVNKMVNLGAKAQAILAAFTRNRPVKVMGRRRKESERGQSGSRRLPTQRKSLCQPVRR